MKIKNIHYKSDYEKFLKEFKLSRQKLSKYMKSLPIEKKWELIHKSKEFLLELKKAEKLKRP